MSENNVKSQISQAVAGSFTKAAQEVGKVFKQVEDHFNNPETHAKVEAKLKNGILSLKELPDVKVEIVDEDGNEVVQDTAVSETLETVPVWNELLENLRANNGIAEINGRITHVAIVGIIGDDLVIIPTKAIKVKDKLNWKAELKALRLDDKIVLESDKFIAKLDVITDAPDIEEMIRKYNDSVEADKQFTGFINI